MHDDLLGMTTVIQDPSAGMLRCVRKTDLPPAPEGWRWSDRLWASPHGEWVALYRPLNLALIYVRRRDRGALLKENPELQECLARERFLLPTGAPDEDENHEHARLSALAREGRFRFICLLPTTRCTLNCTYCHQKPGPGGGADLSLEDLETGLRRCARLCDDDSKPVDILIYGGEPLTAFHLTERVLELAKPRNSLFRQPVRLSFTTSGNGLTPERAALLAQRDVFVIVSLDGPPEVNDPIRRLGRGVSAAEVAERAFKLLKMKGCRVGLSVTIGVHNGRDFKANLEWLLDRFHPDDIGLNAFLHRQNEHANPFQLDAARAFEAVVEGFRITSQRGIYAEQPFRRLKPFAHRAPLLKDCSAPGERLVLAPGGVMGFCDSCYPERRWFYPAASFPAPDHADYQAWAGLSSPEMPACRECAAMTVCGGACRYDAFKASGRLDGADPLRCEFELRFLGWMIWELFDLLGAPPQGFCCPTSAQRERLFGNVRLTDRNQPFTAGSAAKVRS